MTDDCYDMSIKGNMQLPRAQNCAARFGDKAVLGPVRSTGTEECLRGRLGFWSRTGKTLDSGGLRQHSGTAAIC